MNTFMLVYPQHNRDGKMSCQCLIGRVSIQILRLKGFLEYIDGTNELI